MSEAADKAEESGATVGSSSRADKRMSEPESKTNAGVIEENVPDTTISDLVRELQKQPGELEPLVIYKEEEVHLHLIPIAATAALLIVFAVAITRVVKKKRERNRRKRKRAKHKKR